MLKTHHSSIRCSVRAGPCHLKCAWSCQQPAEKSQHLKVKLVDGVRLAGTQSDCSGFCRTAFHITITSDMPQLRNMQKVEALQQAVSQSASHFLKIPRLRHVQTDFQYQRRRLGFNSDFSCHAGSSTGKCKLHGAHSMLPWLLSESVQRSQGSITDSNVIIMLHPLQLLS